MTEPSSSLPSSPSRGPVRLDSASYAQIANLAAESAHRVNPFINHTQAGWWYYCKLVVCGVTLLPIRLLCIVVVFSLIWALSHLAVLGIGVVGPSEAKPFAYWRRLVLEPLRPLLRLVLFLAGFYYIKETGRRDPEAAFLCPNHISIWEGFFVGSRVLASPVSKIENARVPAVGALMTALQPILIDRDASASRTQARDALYSRGKLYKSGRFPPVMIFPEGTCTNGRALVNFKPGAFLAGEPVQPLIIRYRWAHFDPSFVDYVNVVGLLVGTLCQFVNHMEVEWLPIYRPSEEEKANPGLFARNVRLYMSQASGLPMTNHSIDDALLQLEAFKHHLPAEAVGFEFYTLKALLSSLSLPQIKTHLKEFASVAGSQARIGVEQFARVLGMPLTPAVRTLFKTVDTDGNGALNFREWLVSLAFLNQRSEALEQTMRFAFKVFDMNGDGCVSRAEFAATMKRINPSYWDQAAAEALFNKVTSSSAEMISLDEFLNYTRQHPLTASLIDKWTKGEKDLFQFTPSPLRASSSHF
ncbi:MAG: EF-hand domain-containing protein [archaeon]|nr:EF-hand domain-containing protein [archaeon]